MFRNGLIAVAILAAVLSTVGFSAAKTFKDKVIKPHLEQIEQISGSASKTEIPESKDSSRVLKQYEEKKEFRF